MNTKTKEQNAEASRISKLSAAYRRHQTAIQAALEARAQAQRSNMRVITTVAQDGTLYKIGCTTHGYKVVGVEQRRFTKKSPSVEVFRGSGQLCAM